MWWKSRMRAHAAIQIHTCAKNDDSGACSTSGSPVSGCGRANVCACKNSIEPGFFCVFSSRCTGSLHPQTQTHTHTHTYPFSPCLLQRPAQHCIMSHITTTPPSHSIQVHATLHMADLAASKAAAAGSLRHRAVLPSLSLCEGVTKKKAPIHTPSLDQ